MATGKLTPLGVTADVANPSFLAIHPTRRFLYAVNELYRLKRETTGAVSAFAIEPGAGDLTFLNQQPSGGAGPCHLVVDREGRHVLVANYGGGSVCVLPVGADGRLGAATAFVQHHGQSVHPKRQTAPHAHSINLDPANRFAFAADLGLDKVLVYRFDPAAGTLSANEPPHVSVAPGAGPRHFAFHPNGQYAYVINELDSTVAAFTYDAERAILAPQQTVSTLPKGFAGENYPAEVQVHPSGKFLYGSNRGHDSIAIFSVDPNTGQLRAVGHEPTQGKWPRHFGIDPTGAYLLAANQNSDNVVVFRIEPRTGALSPTGHTVKVPGPACVKIVQLAP
jgi:6-phosphogluconolactonase